MNLVATSEELKIIRFGGFMIKEHRDEREFGWKSTLIAPFWEVTLSVPHSIFVLYCCIHMKFIKILSTGLL
jgi:hypothetical protein